MPKVPKWMANAMESLFSGSYHPVHISAVDYLAPALKMVRFEGDFSKLSKPLIPGNVIEFRISDTEFRHYTPSYFNAGKGVCEVLFYLHGKGPGSHWVDRLKQGDQTKLLGPGGKIRFDEQAGSHVCFGDETSLGLLKCLSVEAGTRNTACRCILELDPSHREWPSLVNLGADTVNKSPHIPGEEAVNLIRICAGDLSDTTFYLSGNAKSIQTLKKYLVENGIPGKRIQTEPYWAEGKAGL
ncbi:MAG: siderophore-interacting protein [Leadbetterella sp.]|nr:siderophore-interacting protein [Leadbetterella sp.]